jgi:hypothetical protein
MKKGEHVFMDTNAIIEAHRVMAEQVIKTVGLTKGVVAAVETADYVWASRYSWHAQALQRPTVRRKKKGNPQCLVFLYRELIGGRPEKKGSATGTTTAWNGRANAGKRIAIATQMHSHWVK